jgi:D-glycero-D-manno-heptose 1,7-bisphosphate phosphatase
MNKAVFFDRDDTIIVDVPYSGDASKVTLMPGVIEALSLLSSKDYRLFIISNQSGVGRGLITRDQVRAVNNEMLCQLGRPFFTSIYCCYDDPGNPVDHCRKPSPQMIYQARDEFDLDLAHSFFIGDKLSDMLAGKNAGCRSILVLTSRPDENSEHAKTEAEYIAENLYDAAKWIIEFTTENS